MRQKPFSLHYDNSGDRRLGRGWELRKAAMADFIVRKEGDVVGTRGGFATQLWQLDCKPALRKVPLSRNN